MKNNQTKKKLFNLFDFNRDGKGVDKDDVIGPLNLKNFFKTYFRKFTKLLSVNLIMIFQIPTLFLLIFYASSMLTDFHPIFSIIYTLTVTFLGTPITINSSELFAPVYGMFVSSGSGSASLSQLLNVFGGTIEMPTYSLLYIIVIGILILFSLVTWGWQNIGATYLTRNMVRGEPVFVISDFFYAIKKNIWQGLLFGVIDFAIISILLTDVLFLMAGTSANFFNDIMLFLSIGLSVLYLIMRRYIYLMLITFDIKIWKAFKNAFIFSALGIKRNAMAVLGKALLLIINIALLLLLLPYNIAVMLVLPLVYYFATSAYISAYAYYPVIEQYMITPYKTDEDEFEEDLDEPVTE